MLLYLLYIWEERYREVDLRLRKVEIETKTQLLREASWHDSGQVLTEDRTNMAIKLWAKMVYNFMKSLKYS